MNANSRKYFGRKRNTIYHLLCSPFLYSFLLFPILIHYLSLTYAQIAIDNGPKSSVCPPEWIPFTENKCVKVSSEIFSQHSPSLINYKQGNEYCRSLSSDSKLISLSNNEVPVLLESLSNLIRMLSQANSNLLNTSFLTSALREGSQWIWAEDRVALEIEPVGGRGGRCVALAFTGIAGTQNQTISTNRGRLQMVSVDCTQLAHFALCELNFAVNCTPENGQYEGNIQISSSGMACMQWTDPLITQSGYFCPQQKLWKHNFCRNLNNSAGQHGGRPWCMVSPNVFQECDVPYCKTAPKPVFNNHSLQPCAKGELRCGLSEQCLRSEYWCDYEVDCKNGFDESACADYIQHFQLVGQYKLVDQVTEIWTNIPHVQACAKRCMNTPQTNSTFNCESFCYEPSKELCMLSQQTNNPAVIFPKANSFYYQRNFASGTSIIYTLQPKNNNILIAKKGNMEAPICLDPDTNSNVDSGLAVKLCEQAGYGLPVSTTSVLHDAQSQSKTPLETSTKYYWPLLMAVFPALTSPGVFHQDTLIQPPLSAYTSLDPYWTVDCLLHLPHCNSPIQPKSDQLSCKQFLACSTCDKVKQFTCQSTHHCIESNQICDGKADCSDGSDEQGCAAPLRWSLQAEGRVQLDFHGQLGDVCYDGLHHNENINRICSEIISAKSKGRILPIGQQTPTTLTWHVNCDDNHATVDNVTKSRCRISRMSKCISGILNLKCQRPELNTCGEQQPTISRDPTNSIAKKRVARIVGGFNTRPGQSPWTAALRLKLGDSHHCGAAIIAPRFLLTAAHCFQETKETKDFLVVTGDYDNGVEEGSEQRHNLTAIHFHPQYNQDLFQHDIAILELEDSAAIEYKNVSQPICLPPRGFQYVEGEICTVTGWGSNGQLTAPADVFAANGDSANGYPKRMQAARLPILNTERCKNVSKIYAAIGPMSFCAGYLANGGVDSCQGDSGGPFACEYNGHFYLAGIISWGEGCAQKEHPGIYTMLTPYLSWIENITKITF